MSEKIPVKIRSDKILDHQCRWVCQRLEANWEMMRLILVELRDMGLVLRAQHPDMLPPHLSPSAKREHNVDEEKPPFLPHFKVESDE